MNKRLDSVLSKTVKMASESKELEENNKIMTSQMKELRKQLEGFETEVARLMPAETDPNKKENIWNMKKAELVEVARRELGMTLAEAHKTKVTFLREQIRKKREVDDMTSDPLAKLPTGLGRMTLAELKALHEERNLPHPGKITKVILEQMIRDDCLARQAEEKRLASQWTQEMEATLSANGQGEANWMEVETVGNEDYGVPTHSMHTPRSRPRKTRGGQPPGSNSQSSNA